ncbi:MAG: CheR family methyltransferase, partial [Polyangiales bacterium]
IAFHLEVAPECPGIELDLVATDADARLVERARVGCYERGSLREVPKPWMDAAFERDGELSCVRSEMRTGVQYRVEDVRRQMPDGPFRLILCRNVAFTYFDAPTQRVVLDRFVERLAPGGYLALGSHERLPAGPRLVDAYEHLPLHRWLG